MNLYAQILLVVLIDFLIYVFPTHLRPRGENIIIRSNECQPILANRTHASTPGTKDARHLFVVLFNDVSARFGDLGYTQCNSLLQTHLIFCSAVQNRRLVTPMVSIECFRPPKIFVRGA
jgi:hypothetical protein